MGTVRSVNVGVARPVGVGGGLTGIDKRPTSSSVEVAVPGPGGSGLVGDAICDRKDHGGPDQAVYAYAREDLDDWQGIIDRELADGAFGENLTTVGIDVTGARVGERWRIGDELVLVVTTPRIPCRTFAVWLDQQGWIQTFTRRARPGAYFRVVHPGRVAAGDAITVEHRPDHDVTMELAFRATTRQPELLPRLLAAADLPEELRERVRRHRAAALD